jgi:hypothetical protein
MPRKSSTAAAFSTSTTARLQPPDDLNQLERQQFVNLVLGVRADHFVPADIPTISAYARAVIAERIADGELGACPVIDGKPSPWLPIWMGRLSAVLARRLRLNPAGSQPSKSAEGRQDPAPTSYYERLALEGRRDDAN